MVSAKCQIPFIDGTSDGAHFEQIGPHPHCAGCSLSDRCAASEAASVLLRNPQTWPNRRSRHAQARREIYSTGSASGGHFRQGGLVPPCPASTHFAEAALCQVQLQFPVSRNRGCLVAAGASSVPFGWNRRPLLLQSALRSLRPEWLSATVTRSTVSSAQSAHRFDPDDQRFAGCNAWSISSGATG